MKSLFNSDLAHFNSVLTLFNSVLTLFNSVLTVDQIATSKEDLAYYGKDAGHHFQSNALLILFPKTTDEVQKCIKIAALNNIKIVPSGGRTGYSGGATATQQEVILSLERMNKIISTSLADSCITVQAGVTLERVQQAAQQLGLYYPIDFTSRGSANIAGTIATNAGGVRVIRYGMTREWVLGLQVVTAQGEILELNRNLYKNNTGYDLVQLFCGSEGTLGIITEATLKLTTPPVDKKLACLALQNESSIVHILEKVRAAKFCISLFEFMDKTSMEVVHQHHAIPKPFQTEVNAALLLEVESSSNDSSFNDFLMELLDQKLISDVIVAENSQQMQHLMQLRELIGDALNKNYTVHKLDISVPISTISEFLKLLRQSLGTSYRFALFGHVGDGNIHVNIIKPEQEQKDSFFTAQEKIDETIFTLVASVHGSISAEHGVGLLKKPYLNFSRSSAEISIMQEIKRALDPANILNPNKIISI